MEPNSRKSKESLSADGHKIKTRQAWYVQQWSAHDQQLQETIIIKSVQQIRQQMPHIGARKLHYMLGDILVKHGVSVRRNKFFDLLK